MKKIIVALLATGLMGSALAQSTPPSKRTQPQAAPATVAGTKTATTQSLGELTPYAVIVGAVVVGAIVAASSGGGHKTSTPPPTGTTGTN